MPEIILDSISDGVFTMAHASLGIAEENSGKMVSLIRREGMKLAEEKNLDLLLTNGPPGVGCPVIASLGVASAVLIVAEPTVSGKHDMERVSELAVFFIACNGEPFFLFNTHCDASLFRLIAD